MQPNVLPGCSSGMLCFVHRSPEGKQNSFLSMGTPSYLRQKQLIFVKYLNCKINLGSQTVSILKFSHCLFECVCICVHIVSNKLKKKMQVFHFNSFFGYFLKTQLTIAFHGKCTMKGLLLRAISAKTEKIFLPNA